MATIPPPAKPPAARGPQSPTGYPVWQTYRKGESDPVRIDGNVVGHLPVDEIFP